MDQVALFLEWWIWGLLAILLFVVEVMVTGFVFLGFGIGAAIVALLLFLGWLGTNLAILVLIFAVISLIAWFAMRRVFGLRRGQVKVWEKDINDDV
ncbi:NfeD family protein [Celeribacter indicus]|uniref:NfeD-like C-terminal domain-containing protein n=1 Tax=Celeribacter indicus TaxID=1208324 RepID=A0A0B5DNP1_9RHOB|nr:hypothetical protein [Celeribacter indicus]AJE45173.1 hypothetical protein P73_0458 [Celeribacter indicus]SDX25814.1 hypothetical protein SAMN05443573_1199 [Celeribacter indicus]